MKSLIFLLALLFINNADADEGIKLSNDANYLIKLWSDSENTSFIVDGKLIGVMKSPDDNEVSVLVDRKKEHLISATNPAYKNPQNQTVQPDSNNAEAKINFTFPYTDAKDYVEPKEPQSITQNIYKTTIEKTYNNKTTVQKTYKVDKSKRININNSPITVKGNYNNLSVGNINDNNSGNQKK